MSEPNPQQLQRHKDTVKDTLQGLLDTVAQIPGLIHDSSSKEVCLLLLLAHNCSAICSCMLHPIPEPSLIQLGLLLRCCSLVL
jgi:hypothetical protein